MKIRFGLLSFITPLLMILFIFNATYAASGNYRTLLIENARKLEIWGQDTGGQFGSSVKVGDFNDDGIDDVVIGAPFTSNGARTWNGKVSIVFGSKKFSGETQLIKSKVDYSISGAFSGDQFGTSLAVGDFNGDGIDDLAIGAQNAYYSGNRPGRVYIVYGHSNMGRQSLDLLKHKPDLILTGVDNLDSFGLKLFSFDLENDGFDDLFVGAPMAVNSAGEKSGAVYMYNGEKNALSSYKNQSIYGEVAGERFGSSIALGDLNGDDIVDLAIGAYLLGNVDFPQYGRVYLYKNTRSTFSASTAYINGSYKNGWFGFELLIDDYNNDGVSDLFASYFPYMGGSYNSKVVGFLGARNFFDKREEINIVNGGIGEAVVGSNIVGADLDGDKGLDVIAGAPGIGSPISYEEGQIHINYSNGDYSIITGENPDDWFGYSLKTLDFNGDGYIDIVTGARYADIENGINNGKVYIIFGTKNPFGNVSNIVPKDKQVNRGQLVYDVINKFDLKTKKGSEIKSCLEHSEFCLFNFMAMSSFNKIKITGKISLYPDVNVGDQYYEEINTATLLGLINGYLEEDQSPFHPELPISRIQALKVVLGASESVLPRYKFELVDALGSLNNLINQFSYFDDVDAQIAHMWWYPRYVNFAVENGIVENTGLFRPDDNITIEELDDLIKNTLQYKNSLDEKN